MSAPSPAPALTARIADFLRRFPPFSYLAARDLLTLSSQVVVKYAPPQTELFAQDSRPQTYFFVVRKGAVRLFRADETVQLYDQLDAGDVFGLRPWIANRPYTVTARASEESLLYAIPFVAFEPLIERYGAIGRYLATSFAGGVRNPDADDGSAPASRALYDDLGKLNDRKDQLTDLTRVPVRRTPLTVPPEESIRSVAESMTQRRVGSVVVVDEADLPLGVVTDRDLRRLVVTGEHSPDDAIGEIMNAPVTTIAPDQRAVDVQLAMVRGRVHHLVVTADGTPDSAVVGVLSNRDLLVALGSSPAAVVAEIGFAQTSTELSRLRERAEQWLRPIVDQRGSMYAAAKIMTEVNDQVTRRAIRLALDELTDAGESVPKLAFCWLSLGSHGRGEQLLRTDQDHAIVFADGTGAEEEVARKFYVALAERTSQLLEETGYERCVGDMMAANPAWCLSLREWEAELGGWVANPSGSSLLNASTLLDRRPTYGDLALGESLIERCSELTRGQRLFQAFLARAAIDNPPPLSFFRSFVVESGGEHEDEFDIKQRAMLPLVDAARVLTIDQGLGHLNNTVDRYDALAEAEPQNAEMYAAAAQAYDTLMLFRARQGLGDGSEGRYFRIKELNKLERLQLRNTFRPIAELLSALKIRFQLSILAT